MSSTWRVGAHLVGAEHPRPEPGARPRSPPACREPLVERDVERLADEVLVRQRDQHRPAGRRPARPSRRVSSSECRVFLPKSCAGSMRMPSRRTPSADRPVGQRGDRRDHVGHDVVERRPGAGGCAGAARRRASRPGRRRSPRRPRPAPGRRRPRCR